MAHQPSACFGSGNQGLEVGQNYGSISAEFHLPPERIETPPPPSATIPVPRDADFIDRGDILDQVHLRCSEPAGRVALVGLGGVGKSQLAIEYAHRVAAGQPDRWLFWIHAGTQARVEEGFKTIADTIKLPGRGQPKANIPQLVSGWLSNERNGRWIMILDSADDYDVFYKAGEGREGQVLASYLPQSRNGAIIVTTRSKELARRLTGDHKKLIEIGPMAEDEALALLEKKLGQLADRDPAQNLVQALDYVPLAISQAAAYIHERAPRSSVEKYLAEFREGERKQAKLLGYDGGDLRRDGGASNAVLTTWQISFEYIRDRRRSAADLLSLMSFFNRQGIPESLLRSSELTVDELSVNEPQRPPQSDAGSDADSVSEPESDSSAEETDDGFEDDVTMLRNFCLITPDKNGDVFEMHGLVQLSTRKWLEACKLQEKFKQQFIIRMAGSFPTGDYSNWATCRQLFAHVEAAADQRPAEESIEKWASLMHNGGWYAWTQGRYEGAERMMGKAQRSRKKSLGEDDERTLASTSLLALVFLYKGLWVKAELLFVQEMETRKRVLGEEHPDTLISMGNLALTYSNQGRWKEAESLEVQVMETRKRVLGEEHPSTLTSMGNLALTYSNQGRWKEAESLEVQVMEKRQKVLGEEHPDTLTSMGNLASTYSNQGRWKEAESLEVRVTETRKRVLGEEHPDTLASMNNLASTYMNQGRWKEAEDLQGKELEICSRVLGEEHPSTLTSMANLASMYRNQGRWKEAESLEVQVIETRKRVLGEEHPSTLTSMANLASTYRNQGRWKEAESLDVRVMETRKRVLGEEHPDTLASMNNLAFTWKGQYWHADALALMKDCAQLQLRVIGPKHPDTLSSLAAVAEWSG